MPAIDYGHQRNGIFYHGVLSDLDGVPRATWTYEGAGRKVTCERPLDPAAFRSLCDELATLSVFRRHKVDDPNREIDPARAYVISLVAQQEGQPTQDVYLIPAQENDPEFLHWLQTLNVPTAGAAQREEVYAAFFGDKRTVDRDTPPQGVPIDVYVFEPGQPSGAQRDFYTLLTSGLSDLRMNVPQGAPFRRAELLLYAQEPQEQYIQVLRWLARLPHVQAGTWYGPGTTMTNGQPPQPIFDGSELDCYLFLFPIVGQDHTIHEQLTLDDDPTAILWVVPITHDECQYIINHSLDAFLDVLDKKQHPFLLDPARRSYIRDGQPTADPRPWWRFW